MLLCDQPKVGEARCRNANSSPAMDRRCWRFDESGDRTGAAQIVDDGVCIMVHDHSYAIIASQSQAPFAYLCDYSDGDLRTGRTKGRMDKQTVRNLMRARGWRQVDLAEALQINQDMVSKSLSGVRQWKADEIFKLQSLLGDHENSSDHPEQSPRGNEKNYVDISVLPSYAGMGGGGNGEGEQSIAKLPRELIEEQLRGSPSDFELIDVRGDSMQPDFQHGGQILIDTRDRDPRQPGPFALWDEDGYVVKLVERVPGKRGWYRIFSANDRYSDYEIEETETTIRGRPVWFARQL